LKAKKRKGKPIPKKREESMREKRHLANKRELRSKIKKPRE